MSDMPRCSAHYVSLNDIPHTQCTICQLCIDAMHNIGMYTYITSHIHNAVDARYELHKMQSTNLDTLWTVCVMCTNLQHTGSQQLGTQNSSTSIRNNEQQHSEDLFPFHTNSFSSITHNHYHMLSSMSHCRASLVFLDPLHILNLPYI